MCTRQKIYVDKYNPWIVKLEFTDKLLYVSVPLSAIIRPSVLYLLCRLKASLSYVLLLIVNICCSSNEYLSILV